jgi:hypothetical protein
LSSFHGEESSEYCTSKKRYMYLEGGGKAAEIEQKALYPVEEYVGRLGEAKAMFFRYGTEHQVSLSVSGWKMQKQEEVRPGMRQRCNRRDPSAT